MQLPSAMALGMVQLGTMMGKLNGTMEATTPSGTCSVRHSTPLLTSSTSPVISCGKEQANSVSSMHFSTSATDSPMVLPFSCEHRRASSGSCFSSKVLYRKKTCTLSFIGVRDQAGNAKWAAATALSRSAFDDNGTVDNSCPSMGEITGIVRPASGSTNLPPIKF